MKTYAQRTFRPWKENQQRLEQVDRIGLNVSEVINEVLDEHLERHLERKVEKMRQALAS